MKYIDETRNRYRDPSVASTYKAGYEGKLSLDVLRNKFVAFFERSAVKRALTNCSNVNTVLDVPCGTGKLTSILNDLEKFYVGADVSFEMMQEIDDKRNACLVQADGTMLPFKDGSYDVVISLRLIHRLPADVKKAFIRELSRTSKKYLIFSFPKDSVFYKTINMVKRCVGIVPEKIFFDPFADYHDILEGSGMKFVRAYPVLVGVSNQFIFVYRKDQQ